MASQSTRHFSICLIRYETTVDVDALASDVALCGRFQEYRLCGAVLWLIGALQRYALNVTPLDLLGADVLLLRDCSHHIEVETCAHNAGAHGVDVDVVRAQLLRGRLGKADDGALAGSIDGVRSARIALTGDGGDIDDAAAAAWDHCTRHSLQAEDHAF